MLFPTESELHVRDSAGDIAVNKRFLNMGIDFHTNNEPAPATLSRKHAPARRATPQGMHSTRKKPESAMLPGSILWADTLISGICHS
jgi:hypothetical protein